MGGRRRHHRPLQRGGGVLRMTSGDGQMLMGAQLYMGIFATSHVAPASATTYYFSQWAAAPVLTQGAFIGVFLRGGKIKRIGINVIPLVVAGGAQLGTLSLLLNGVTEYIISSGVDWSLPFAAYGGGIFPPPAG